MWNWYDKDFLDNSNIYYSLEDNKIDVEKAKYALIEYVAGNNKLIKNFPLSIGSSFTLAEIAEAGVYLFKNGYLKANIFRDGKYKIDTKNVVLLTKEDIATFIRGGIWISCHFNTIGAYFYLTPKGIELWKKMANFNWDNFFEIEMIYGECIIRSTKKKTIEKVLELEPFILELNSIEDTQIWKNLVPFKATYWKELPKGYEVTYQAKYNEYLYYKKYYKNFSPEETEKYEKANQWYEEIKQWYSKPKFDINTPSIFEEEIFSNNLNPKEKSNQEIEYLILEKAVNEKNYAFISDVKDYKNFSNEQIAIAAKSLMEKGLILATINLDIYRIDNIENVTLNLSGIIDLLQKRFLATYHLTNEGGKKWESLTNANWDNFLEINLIEDDESHNKYIIRSTQKEIIEKILDLEHFILEYESIKDTQIWETLEPFRATYWKELSKGYQVIYEVKYNECFNSKNFPPEERNDYKKATKWFNKIKKWYHQPKFDLKHCKININ